jgi:hypothetical protein
MLYEGSDFVQPRSKYTVLEDCVDRGTGTPSTCRGRVENGGMYLPLS